MAIIGSVKGNLWGRGVGWEWEGHGSKLLGKYSLFCLKVQKDCFGIIMFTAPPEFMLNQYYLLSLLSLIGV